MNIDEVVFARKIPGKRYFASNFSTWPGILLLLVVSTRQKHQYQGEKCARHGITSNTRLNYLRILATFSNFKHCQISGSGALQLPDTGYPANWYIWPDTRCLDIRISVHTYNKFRVNESGSVYRFTLFDGI